MSKKDEFIDDGRTIYNMDVDGMPHRRSVKRGGVDISSKERRAIVLAIMGRIIPALLIVILGFGIAMLIIRFWLG